MIQHHIAAASIETYWNLIVSYCFSVSPEFWWVTGWPWRTWWQSWSNWRFQIGVPSVQRIWVDLGRLRRKTCHMLDDAAVRGWECWEMLGMRRCLFLGLIHGYTTWTDSGGFKTEKFGDAAFFAVIMMFEVVTLNGLWGWLLQSALQFVHLYFSDNVYQCLEADHRMCKWWEWNSVETLSP